MTPVPLRLADRLARLVAALLDLADRVRDAVAAETGRLVADAVGGLVTDALSGGPDDPPARAEIDADWSDDSDPWADAGEFAPTPISTPVPWAAALTAGLAAGRWLAARRVPIWASVALAAAVSAAARFGGPVVGAAVAAYRPRAG